jgi:thiamine-phosphate pyrophosphorylase
VIRYAITDRRLVGGVEALLRQVRRNVASGVDYIQIREKDMADRDLFALACSIVSIARGTATRVVINGRVDIALAARAQGVHLPGDAIPPLAWRPVVPEDFVIGVSCHSLEELRVEGADYALYAPVFAPRSKSASLPALGIEGLREGCRVARMPVLALGGITREIAQACVDAGAAGVAGITLFQEPE